jgi:hypothetical protein
VKYVDHAILVLDDHCIGCFGQVEFSPFDILGFLVLKGLLDNKEFCNRGRGLSAAI